MLNWLANIYKWILIFYTEGFQKRALISFIFKINPYENHWMMSDEDLFNEYTKFDNFLKVNSSFTIELLKSKWALTDFDYLDKYKELKLKTKTDIGNPELLKYLLYWNGKLIQSKTKWTYKHEYHIKVSTSITDLSDDKEIMAKRKEVTNLLTHFPYIEKALNTYEVIILLLKEKRFFKEELINITKESLQKWWIIQ